MVRKEARNRREPVSDYVEAPDFEDPLWLKELKTKLISGVPELIGHLYKDRDMADAMDKLAVNLDRIWALGMRVGRSSTKLDLGMAVFGEIMERYYQSNDIGNECRLPIGGLDTKKKEDDAMAALACAIAGPKAYDETGGKIHRNKLVTSGRRAIFKRENGEIVYKGTHLPIFLSVAGDVVMGARILNNPSSSEVHNKLPLNYDPHAVKDLHKQIFGVGGDWMAAGKVPIDCINAEAAFVFQHGQDRRDGRGVLTQISKLYHLGLLPKELIEKLEINPFANMGFDLLHPDVVEHLFLIDPESNKELKLTDPENRYRLMAFEIAKLGFPLERLLVISDALPYLTGEGRDIDSGNAILKWTEVDGGHWLDLTGKSVAYQTTVNQALWIRK